MGDTSAITGHVSLYLDPLTSYPFVPGHEVVGVLDDGSRVVVEPALGCVVRGIDPPCPRCAEGRAGLCYNVTEGPIEVGLQTGYCADTGGGWGEVLVAHPSQVHPVSDKLSDEAAVLIEPLACCIHAALRGGATKDDIVVVSGSGTIGLLTIAAVKTFTPPKRLIHEIRKACAWYTKGLPGCAAFRELTQHLVDIDAVIGHAERFFDERLAGRARAA